MQGLGLCSSTSVLPVSYGPLCKSRGLQNVLLTSSVRRCCCKANQWPGNEPTSQRRKYVCMRFIMEFTSLRLLSCYIVISLHLNRNETVNSLPMKQKECLRSTLYSQILGLQSSMWLFDLHEDGKKKRMSNHIHVHASQPQFKQLQYS